MGILVKHYKDPYKQPDIVEIQLKEHVGHNAMPVKIILKSVAQKTLDGCW